MKTQTSIAEKMRIAIYLRQINPSSDGGLPCINRRDDVYYGQIVGKRGVTKGHIITARVWRSTPCLVAVISVWIRD